MTRSVLAAAIASALSLTTFVNAEHGVTDTSIQLGEACALKGPAAALGQGMKTGLNVYFDKVNAAGGIDGRMIELKTVNDSCEPDMCAKATTMLIDNVDVFAMIGGVGTPTAQAAVPICEENDCPFVAPLSGAEFLRNPSKKWVVNLRGSYHQEMERLAEHLVDDLGYSKVACFYQNDGYGQAGLSGIKIALDKRGMELCATGTYEQNTTAVAEGLESIAGSKPDAIVMVGAYEGCAAFIKLAKSNPATRNSLCCNISFVGTRALLRELGPASEGCIVSQVVPYPWDQSIPVIADYHHDMTSAGKSDEVGFITLEGYLAAKLFCMAMENVQGEPTREKFIAAINATGTFDLGGLVCSFGPNDHQGMDQVFLTVFQNGRPVPLDGARVAGAN